MLLAPARVMCYYRLRGRHVGRQRQAQVGTGRQRQAGRQRQVGRHARGKVPHDVPAASLGSCGSGVLTRHGEH